MIADERAESTKGFKNWDKNGDGFLVTNEVPEGPRNNFNNVDRNKDGKVTLEEHLLATVGPEEPEKRKVRKPDTSQFKRHVIRQSWNQEKQGYDREYFVSIPKKKMSKIPVLFVFHGGGGPTIWGRGILPESLVLQSALGAFRGDGHHPVDYECTAILGGCEHGRFGLDHVLCTDVWLV